MNSGLIIIEGNIGAGKSTLAKMLADTLGGECINEPDEKTNPYLADYYKDPYRWAFEMQMFLLTRRYRAQKYAQSKIRHNGGFVVMDRSYYGDVCFANVQLQNGYFSQRDYETYLSHHADMKVNLEPPALAIFLHTDPIVCKERIDKRISEKEGRKCESGISIKYLKQLQEEISRLAVSMKNNTTLWVRRWNDNLSLEQIQGICDNFKTEIGSIDKSVYDFWTGTDGIGK